MANPKQQRNAADRNKTKTAQGKTRSSLGFLGTPPKPKPSKGQDSRKVHDTKGKNNHGRSY